MVTKLPHYLVPTDADRQNAGLSTFTLGVDLGQSIDPTALALIERRVTATGKHESRPGHQVGATEWSPIVHIGFWIRAVELVPLGTRYQNVTARVAERFNQASELGATDLVFDETGARGVGDMIRAVVPDAYAVVLSGGESDNRITAHRWSVSKANMVSALLAAIETNDLKIADGLTDMDAFTAHLTDLRRKISSLGHMTFNAREGAHDDYVTAAGRPPPPQAYLSP